jgi:hypothetical protein
MTPWLTYALTTIGLVYFITQSMIFSPLRVRLTRGSIFREALLYCPSCTGFWVGAGLSLLGRAPGWNGMHLSWDPLKEATENSLAVIDSGLMSMAISHIWSALTQQGVNPAWEAELPLREPPQEPPHAP